MRAENDRGLERAFAALRREYRAEPPAHLEEFLRAQVRRKSQVKSVRAWGAALASAALLLLGLLFAAKNRTPATTAPAVSEHKVPEARQVEQAALPAQIASRHPHRLVRKQPRRSDTQADSFLAIPYAEPLAPSEQVDIYRVELPRVTLAHYGFPLRAATLDSPFVADVAVGSDGVVRAIRFVQ